MKYLFIDIRKSDEVYSKHFGMSGDYKFYNIPMEMIRFNKNTIKKLLLVYKKFLYLKLNFSILNKFFL